MFWKLTALSASSPVESVLDKENFTLEELLDEEEIIQECKALNSRLINFLRDRAQIEQLLRYIVEEPPQDADSKRAFKLPFIACEIFTCEIDVILKTLVEEEELMDLLFSFLYPNRSHSALLAGYFSKVVVCLMMRKTVSLMNYVQAHQDVFGQLVDLIGITSIMEVLVRLVGADDHVYPNFLDAMQWLADSNLLEMIVDKLDPSCLPEVHANAAETLCAITRNTPSALTTKLASSSFVERVFSHASEDPLSKSALVHSLSVCISLLDPKRAAVSSPLFYSFRNQHIYEFSVPVNQETINAMLPRLRDMLMLLNVSSDQKILLTAYGELRPPLGKHRLKIVEFIAVLMRSVNEAAEKELISSGIIQRVLDLFFEYPFNNALHHHVESIVISCIESKNDALVQHLFCDCNLIGKLIQRDRSPTLSSDYDQPTIPAYGKCAPRAGNIGHITRITKKLSQLGSMNSQIQNFLQENSEWGDWQAEVLQERIAVENVLRWACGRPSALIDRSKDSDEEDVHNRDYDLGNNLSQAFSYNSIYGNDETEEDQRGAHDRDDEEIYFDDESAEVVISSLRLGDNQGSLFTNSNWFAFQDDRMEDAGALESSSVTDEGNLSGPTVDEVVVGEDVIGKTDTASAYNNSADSASSGGDPNLEANKTSSPFEIPNSGDIFEDKALPECVAWGVTDSLSVLPTVGNNPFDPEDGSDKVALDEVSYPPPNGSTTGGSLVSPSELSDGDGSVSSNSSKGSSNSMPALFEEDLEFVGVQAEGTEKAMERALKEGIVGEAAPLKRNIIPKLPEKGSRSDEAEGDSKEFNDSNYWRVDQEVAVLE